MSQPGRPKGELRKAQPEGGPLPRGDTRPAARAAAPKAAPPIAAQRLSDQLAQWLAERVRSGALAMGDRLPTEPQLAAAHGVSRTVVREAVHQLKSQGLLRSRQGSGVFGAEASAHQPLAFDPKVLDSLAAVVEMVEVRRALEGEIAALAAQRATPQQVRGLRQALQALDDAVAQGRDGVAEDLAFHRAIAEATGNPQFSRLLGHLEQYLREAMRVTRGNEARHQRFAQAVRSEHQAVVEAIASGDAAAARRAAVRHMQHAEARLVEAGVVQRPVAPGRSRRSPAAGALASSGPSAAPVAQAGKSAGDASGHAAAVDAAASPAPSKRRSSRAPRSNPRGLAAPVP